MDDSEGMAQFLAYHRRMLGMMAGVSLAVTVVLFFALRDDSAWGGGFAVGAAAQLIKFAFLDVAVIRRIAVNRESAPVVQMKSTLFTLVIIGAAAFVTLKLRFNVWAMAAGIFVPRLLLLADAYMRPNPFADKDSGGK